MQAGRQAVKSYDTSVLFIQETTQEGGAASCGHDGLWGETQGLTASVTLSFPEAHSQPLAQDVNEPESTPAWNHLNLFRHCRSPSLALLAPSRSASSSPSTNHSMATDQSSQNPICENSLAALLTLLFSPRGYSAEESTTWALFPSPQSRG